MTTDQKQTEGQIILAIDREFGSGGREIADLLGHYFGLPVYEKNILQNLGIRHQKDVEDLYYRDESPRWKFASRTVKGLTNSNEYALAAMEFDFLRKIASEGKSFIVLGHCAEEVLAEYPSLVTLFISADEAFKIPRIMKEHDVDREEAYAKMKRHNRKRKTYHNSYCEHKWGDARNYDMTIRSDKMGPFETAKFLVDYLEARIPEIKNRERAEELVPLPEKK